MYRSAITGSKRYRNDLKPDWIIRLTHGLHIETKENLSQVEGLLDSPERKTSNLISCKKLSISKGSQPKKTFQEKIEKKQERLDPFLERGIKHFSHSTNHNIATKTKHVYIPKIKQKITHSDKELELQVSSVESEIVKRERIQNAKIILNKKLNESSIINNNQEVNDCLNHCSVNPDDIVTDDDVDEEYDLKRWKSRELSRIKRDENESADRKASQLKHTYAQAIHETDQSLNIGMFHEKIKNHRKERTKMRFLQKFYHKGAFFQEDADDRYGSTGSDPIYKRDYWIPTTSEIFDKTLLPVVMQVKNFGRRGRTKWTHLVAEDTTHIHSYT